ncbi:UNVERIFIED_CONTAM: hypothetical protein PYX00_010399 [Menopon gallinae]
MDNIQNVHLNTLPGSKIYITAKTVDMSHCFLLLYNSNTQFLGGKVDSLVEKWELNRSLAKHTRGGIEEGGPPPWIPFGEKIIKQAVAEKNFKSLDLVTGKNKDPAENSEFEAQRKGAILEATKIGSTKVFGGGNNKLLDYNVQQIVDAGFTIEDAEYALRICKNNLDRALRNLQAKYNKHSKDDNSKSNSKSGNEEKKGGKGRNKHKDEDSGPTLKPSGKVSLFEFLEDKLPYAEPPVETKVTTNEKKSSSSAFKGSSRSSAKSHSERGKAPGEEKRNASEKQESKSQSKKNYDSSKSYGKFDPPERRNYAEKKIEFGKFESKKNFENNPRTDKSYGNFKYNKYDQKNGNADFSSKSEFFKNKSNEKRSQNSVNPSAIKTYNRSFDINEYKKQISFVPMNEKPPRFQKYQNQQSENQVSNIQSWSDQSYNRMPQNEYQLQNSLANLTLQQNLVNFQNQNSQDAYGDILQGVSTANTKQSNMFYQNVVLPTSQSGDSRMFGNRNSQPAAGPPQSHLNNYGNRNTASYLQEVKSSNFPTIPNLQECAFKNSAPVLHGYNEFQSIFAQSARGPSNNYPNTQFVASQNGLPPQSHKPWIWKKGDKCMARYWEDQMFYNAVVTGVSENTCVVKFTDYGNYEEVLQDHCYPITEES